MEPTGENWIHKKIGEDFIVLNSKLGEGAFGVVYKGFRIADETIVILDYFLIYIYIILNRNI